MAVSSCIMHFERTSQEGENGAKKVRFGKTS